MPTPDRTTLRAAIEELVDKLRSNLVADPPTAVKPFRQVFAGRSSGPAVPRPWLSVALIRSQPIGVADNDKLLQVQMEFTLATDVQEADPHGAILDTVAAVDDYFDSIVDAGVLEGVEGFDDRVWSFDYPLTTGGSRLATATAAQTFVVKVQREYNRVPPE